MALQEQTGQHEAGALDALRAAMIERIGRRTVGNTDSPTAIADLVFFRREEPVPPCFCMVEPSIVLVIQGEKQMLVGGEAYPYDVNRFLITSLDLPANSQVITASQEKPCLGLVLKLDRRIMAELIAQGGLPFPAERSTDKGVGIGLGAVTPVLLEPFKRLLNLLDEPETIPVLAPLIEREIHRYSVLEYDGRIIGCVAMHPFLESRMAEMACLVVDPAYREQNCGEQLLRHIEQQAKGLGVRKLFVLTTRTAHWFIERGFAPATVDDLPIERKRLYNYQRKSKVFIKQIAI